MGTLYLKPLPATHRDFCWLDHPQILPVFRSIGERTLGYHLEDADLVFFFSQVGKLTAIDPAVVKPNRWAELTPPQIQHDLLSMIGAARPIAAR